MDTYRDRTGNVIDREEWADLLTDEFYRLVATTTFITHTGAKAVAVVEWTGAETKPFTASIITESGAIFRDHYNDEDCATACLRLAIKEHQ